MRAIQTCTSFIINATNARVKLESESRRKNGRPPRKAISASKARLGPADESVSARRMARTKRRRVAATRNDGETRRSDTGTAERVARSPAFSTARAMMCADRPRSGRVSSAAFFAAPSQHFNKSTVDGGCRGLLALAVDWQMHNAHPTHRGVAVPIRRVPGYTIFGFG
jgi:hypothetical protein